MAGNTSDNKTERNLDYFRTQSKRFFSANVGLYSLFNSAHLRGLSQEVNGLFGYRVWFNGRSLAITALAAAKQNVRSINRFKRQ